METKQTLPAPEALAIEFSRQLRAELSEQNMALVVSRNKTQEYSGGICASHDFCDANEVMLAAWMTIAGSEHDLQSEAQCSVWSDAWLIAKASGFSVG